MFVIACHGYCQCKPSKTWDSVLFFARGSVVRYPDFAVNAVWRSGLALDHTMTRQVILTIEEKNIVHGSDAPETAAFEMAYFFNNLEIIS